MRDVRKERGNKQCHPRDAITRSQPRQLDVCSFAFDREPGVVELSVLLLPVIPAVPGEIQTSCGRQQDRWGNGLILPRPVEIALADPASFGGSCRVASISHMHVVSGVLGWSMYDGVAFTSPECRELALLTQ